MLPLCERWLQRYSARGGFAIELCPKANHLHLQGVVQFRGGKNFGMGKAEVVKSFKAFLDIKRGQGYSMKVVEFGATSNGTQNIRAMMGYIQKDQGARHYDIKTVGFTQDELEDSLELIKTLRVSHEAERIVIHRSSIIKAMFQFQYRECEPLQPNALRTLTWMLQSNKYMPSGDWIIGRSGKRVDRTPFKVMWRIANDPKTATMSDAATLFIEHERTFSPLSTPQGAWNQDGCAHLGNYFDAMAEVERLREHRTREAKELKQLQRHMGLEESPDAAHDNGAGLGYDAGEDDGASDGEEGDDGYLWAEL